MFIVVFSKYKTLRSIVMSIIHDKNNKHINNSMCVSLNTWLGCLFLGIERKCCNMYVLN